LASAGLNVVEASAATWGDGGVVETFRVAASGPPDPTRLTAAIDASLDAMQAVPGVPDAVVEFDDAGSPWYTLCSIRAGDRPGLLNALALAFAVSGVNVHSARVTTQERRAEDLFELSDRRGRKLDERTKQLVREAIATGVRVRPRRFARPRKFVLDRPAGRSTAALAVAKNW
jgi:UTP:GlnB (protein PII) uridylyltransferase